MAEQTTKRATQKALDAFCTSNNITPESIWDKLSSLYPNKYIPDTIVSSGAKGADTYAREFAQKHNLTMVEYLPEYDKYPPKLAPLERNKLIVDNSDCVLAFWDGTSRGTKFTIDYTRKKNKPIKIVQI